MLDVSPASWLRAHIGQVANERADQLAKLAAYSSTLECLSLPCPISFVKRRIMTHVIHQWNEHWINSAKVQRCGAIGSMRACHTSGPGSIPGRGKFPG